MEKDNVVTVSRDLDGKALTAGLSDAERKKGRENFDFYCFLIWPFIESTWLGAVALMGLTPPLEQKEEVWLDGAKTQDAAQLLGKTLYHQGDLSYFEAVNKETLKNAFQLFEDEGIVLLQRSKDKKISSTMKLAKGWTPKRDPATGNIFPEGNLWSFIETIASSRREGKNRRDGATVSTRVLILADTIGRQLFESAAATSYVAIDTVRSPKKGRRKDVQTKAKL